MSDQREAWAVVLGAVFLIGLGAAIFQTITEGGEWNWPLTIVALVGGGIYAAVSRRGSHE